MAVIQKTLFAENLDKYNTFVVDTDPFSKYFKITELADTFTGGKNAFLIQGSNQLVSDTLIKIEIKDSQGNTIYYEPGEGIISSSVAGEQVVTEYYEGVSKVVAVHVYPDTTFGPCTITILGELSEYYNEAGTLIPVPDNWQGTYNVKWQKQVNVNPKLPNTTKIRFYKRPTATITETLSPIYTIVSGSKVESNIVSSFANVTLSKLDTFAGDVKRIKVYRTSEGDISDYDMIQDILVESKELLTSYELTGSVVGEAGLMTSEVLEKLWNYPTLTTQLTSSRVDNGVKLNGSGYFTFTSSLNLSENSVYEFGIDAFYSSSTPSNMGIYISGSNNGEVLVGTLVGIEPTKNLNDSLFQFTLPLAEPSASLYLSQSQSEWHVGNLSLKLTQDTAFSPSEIGFVTSMPTVIGNETYNFKFEFYDVNNNYVPVEVTSSALFTGGNNNLGGTLIFISASASSSLSQLYAVSSSISGTAALYSSSADSTITTLSGSVDTTIVTLSGSVDTTIVTLSGSVSGSITTLSGSVSGSITTLSGSVSGSINTLSGSVSASITSLSASVSSSNALILSSSFAQVKNLANGQFSGSFIGDTVIYSPAIGGQVGYIKELFTVGDTSAATINLDARTSTRKIWIGSGANGVYNDSNTGVYLDGTGKFSLKDKLTWDGATLNIIGNLSVGSSVPNSVVSGLGALALKSSVAAGTSDVSGFGGLATKSSVGASEIDAGAVTEGKIGTGAVSNAKIAADAITEAKIATNAITEGKISANAIVADKIAANAIVADKIAANAVTAGKIIAGAIEADKIAANAITAGKIAADAITADKIAANAITATKISANAITAGKIEADAVTADKIGVTELSAIGATVGGWSMDTTRIYNTNVTIDNTNSRIEFKNGAGVVKTRIKFGDTNIGTPVGYSGVPISGPIDSDYDTATQSNPYTVGCYSFGQGATQTNDFTLGSAGATSKVIISFTIPALGTLGTLTNSAGTANHYGYASFHYKVTNTTTGWTSGWLSISSGYSYSANPSLGVIPIQIVTNQPGVTGHTYRMESYIYKQVNANASGGAVGTTVTSSLTSNLITNTNVTIIAIDSVAEYGTNGLSVGADDGTYVSMGLAAGSGYCGLFSGNVYIGGTLYATTLSTSDKRIKTNILDITNGIEKVKSLRPVDFEWLESVNPNDVRKRSFGFIADDVQEVFPQLVFEKSRHDIEDFKHLDYQSFHALSIKAIQELIYSVEIMQEKITELENKISGSI